MLVHPHKRQLKVHFENTARTEVTSGPSPYLWQAPAENDNRIWQLKSRSGGGEKTSASSKIRSVLTQRLQRASFPPLRAVHRHWLSTDSSPFKASFPKARDVLIPDPAWDSFWGRKKNSRRCPIFSNSPTNMSAFLFKQPREATSKCQVRRMRKEWTIGANRNSNMLLLRTRIRQFVFFVFVFCLFVFGLLLFYLVEHF